MSLLLSRAVLPFALPLSVSAARRLPGGGRRVRSAGEAGKNNNIWTLGKKPRRRPSSVWARVGGALVCLFVIISLYICYCYNFYFYCFIIIVIVIITIIIIVLFFIIACMYPSSNPRSPSQENSKACGPRLPSSDTAAQRRSEHSPMKYLVTRREAVSGRALTARVIAFYREHNALQRP